MFKKEKPYKIVRYFVCKETDEGVKTNIDFSPSKGDYITIHGKSYQISSILYDLDGDIECTVSITYFLKIINKQ